MESLPELRSFLNAEGKLVALPAKKRKKLPALYFPQTSSRTAITRNRK